MLDSVDRLALCNDQLPSRRLIPLRSLTTVFEMLPGRAEDQDDVQMITKMMSS